MHPKSAPGQLWQAKDGGAVCRVVDGNKPVQNIENTFIWFEGSTGKHLDQILEDYVYIGQDPNA